MTPRQLRYFVEIARTGSVTTAASTLHIAQPALSHHVASMEEELGVPLLERHARGVRLTPEGQRLLERATSILAQLERLPDDVRDRGATPRGPVHLYVAGAVANVLASPLYRLVESLAPEVRLLLSTGLSTEGRTMAETRRVDLALMPNAFESPGLQAQPVFEESFALFGTAHAFGALTGPVRFAEIGVHPLVAPDRDHDIRKHIERTALALNCPLNVRYEINSAELSRALVRDGLAFSIMPANAYAGVEGRDVVAREIVEPRMTRVQSIVLVGDNAETPAGQLVRDALRRVIASLIDEKVLKAKPVT